MRVTAADRDDATFAIFVKAACEGVRCPKNDDLPAAAGTGRLARAGRIRVEVYEHNYRVVEIRAGDHTGKRTAEHPSGRKPYRVIDEKGDQWVSRTVVGALPTVRHVPRKRDTDALAPPSVTLPRVKFIEGKERT